MIARLKGTLAETGTDYAVIDVQGVGYLAHVSGRTLAAMGAIGNDVLLLTDMQVREDAITLFGFGSPSERDWFRLLTGVQGVGGKVGLNILTALTPDELVRAIGNQDKAMVARANGVGPKLAQRIVIELKDKVSGFVLTPGAGMQSAPLPSGSHAADAASALGNLGFKPHEASTAVAAALDELGDDATLDALVRLALKKAAK